MPRLLDTVTSVVVSVSDEAAEALGSRYEPVKAAAKQASKPKK